MSLLWSLVTIVFYVHALLLGVNAPSVDLVFHPHYDKSFSSLVFAQVHLVLSFYLVSCTLKAIGTVGPICKCFTFVIFCMLP